MGVSIYDILLVLIVCVGVLVAMVAYAFGFANGTKHMYEVINNPDNKRIRRLR